jgi:hypothetical protein
VSNDFEAETTPEPGEGAEARLTSHATVLAFPARRDGAVTWETWLSERAIARHYAVSARTIRRWRQLGMPSGVFGGVRRYRLSECEGWHEQRRSP